MNKLGLKLKKDSNIVNRYKLIYIPLLIGFIGIFIVAISSYFISKYYLLKQMEDDGESIAQNVVYQVQKNKIMLDALSKYVEDDIRRTSQIVIRNQENLSNEFLKGLAEDMKVNEIDYYDDDGVIVYSNFDNYVKWKGDVNHSSQSFKKGNDKELIEEVRENAITGQLYKYGYVRSYKGGFIQVGVLWDEVKKMQEKFNYQTLVDELSDSDSIVYMTIFDKNLKTIADSDAEDIGLQFDPNEEKALQGTLEGKKATQEWYYDRIKENILEISIPIYVDNEIVNGLDIGFSMKNVNKSIYTISVISTIIAFVVTLLFILVQNKNIVRPVNRLDEQIEKIDLEENIDYRIPLVEKSTFYGLTDSINKILDKASSYFHQLNANQMKLFETYEQLAASEEELRAQYDEIQIYTRQIEHVAEHDSLTNLPNRRNFDNRLEQELNANRSGAVMLLDIDNFKGINDTLGHLYGDKVLKKVAEELETIKTEKILISRFGGDEFIVLITEEDDASVVEAYANKIADLFKHSLLIGKDEINISFSMGITLYPLDSCDASQLVMNADLAMYKVKNSGRNHFMFFNEKMANKLIEHINVEKSIREALKDGNFKILYQPLIATFTGKVDGFEALLRMKNVNISPAVFIPIAEEKGLIVEIGRWVTKEVIKQISVWKKKGLDIKPVAINFSVNQLSDINYVDFLVNTLKSEGVEAKYIHIEITESIFLEKKEETLLFIKKLKELGIRIALDDFGTGYSSLNYLTFLPVDKIKLDKSLNDKFLELENVKVMDNLISLAHSLNLQVVAEGIETIDQYKRLRVGKCNQIQGYLFSKPLEVEDAEKIYDYNFFDKLNPS
jgi:diguanylate cyclase (GGDEF)-like protein